MVSNKWIRGLMISWCLGFFFNSRWTDDSLSNTSSVSRYWPYGSEGCQTHGFQGFCTALASIHFIAAIAWDRYHQYCTSEFTPDPAQTRATCARTRKGVFVGPPADPTASRCSERAAAHLQVACCLLISCRLFFTFILLKQQARLCWADKQMVSGLSRFGFLWYLQRWDIKLALLLFLAIINRRTEGEEEVTPHLTCCVPVITVLIRQLSTLKQSSSAVVWLLLDREKICGKVVLLEVLRGQCWWTFWPRSCQGRSCSGAAPSLWLCSSGSSPPSGPPCPSLAGESTTTSPSGPAALWTTARGTGAVNIPTLLAALSRQTQMCSQNSTRWASRSFFFLHRNYVSYLLPMSVFNMAIQVFVVMSSYQSIAQKFKKTGNPRVSKDE